MNSWTRRILLTSSCLTGLLLGGGGCMSPGEPEPSTEARQNTPESGLTLERLLADPPVTGTGPSAPTWSPNSELLAFRWNGAGNGPRGIWIVAADGTDRRPLTGTTAASGSVQEIAWLPDSTGLAFLRGGALWRTSLQGPAEHLVDLPRGASSLAISPDGSYASLLVDGDLWLFEFAAAELTQRTNVSVPAIGKVPLGRYRRRDVEIGPYVWGGPRYAWSPDSRTLAVHHVDRTELPTVPFPHYLGDETDPNPVRRSYPGQPNEQRRVGLVRVDSSDIEFLDLPDPTDVRIVDFSWSTEGRLLIDRESDTATDRWLHVFDPAAGSLEEIYHDHRDSRVYTSCGSAWHPNGTQVIALLDRADRYGVYAVDTKGGSPRLLSSEAADATSPPQVGSDGSIFYTSNAASPYERRVERTATDAQEPVPASSLVGESRPYPSPDGKRLALLHGSDEQPAELYLSSATDDPASALRITNSLSPEFAQLELATPRYVSFPSQHDDATLHARILEPANLDHDVQYPVLFGPVYSNTVRNRWGGFYGLLQQVLVARGYIVVQVDVRGSTGYGREFREQFLADFAGRDLEDLESAVAYMESLPHVDPDRIGIWGSSYGGTLTTYALLKKPGLFNAGVACASAVDPHFFGSDDVAIVRRPDTHPEAFERGAAQYAANLEDPLLLIHGMQDQIVPFKTVVVLAEELMRHGKDFDFAFAPAGTHGWTRPRHYARYLLGKLIAHFDQHLQPGRGD